MKLKFTPLLLSLYLAILPITLRAKNKNVSEADAASPITINKGDTLTFSFNNAAWTYTVLAGIFSDATILANDPGAAILSWASTNTNTSATESSIAVAFNAINNGQMVILFTQAGADSVYKYEKAVTFVVNIKDPAATK